MYLLFLSEVVTGWKSLIFFPYNPLESKSWLMVFTDRKSSDRLSSGTESIFMIRLSILFSFSISLHIMLCFLFCFFFFNSFFFFLFFYWFYVVNNNIAGRTSTVFQESSTRARCACIIVGWGWCKGTKRLIDREPSPKSLLVFPLARICLYSAVGFSCGVFNALVSLYSSSSSSSSMFSIQCDIRKRENGCVEREKERPVIKQIQSLHIGVMFPVRHRDDYTVGAVEPRWEKSHKENNYIPSRICIGRDIVSIRSVAFFIKDRRRRPQNSAVLRLRLNGLWPPQLMNPFCPCYIIPTLSFSLLFYRRAILRSEIKSEEEIRLASKEKSDAAEWSESSGPIGNPRQIQKKENGEY